MPLDLSPRTQFGGERERSEPGVPPISVSPPDLAELPSAGDCIVGQICAGIRFADPAHLASRMR